MKLEVVKAHRAQIFNQIMDGIIPAQAIFELFDVLIAIAETEGYSHIAWRTPAWEAKADGRGIVIDLEQYRRARKSPPEDGEHD